jgi:elongation of very long chain fatty acids protein 4
MLSYHIYCFILKVYHHSSVLLLSDYSYHFYPWPSIGFMLGLNSFVHVFLYLYYGQSALYQTQRPTWKKHMTELQIFQFLLGLVHCAYGYLHYKFCVYGIFYGISMLGLFGNFYYQAYIQVKPVNKKQE